MKKKYVIAAISGVTLFLVGNINYNIKNTQEITKGRSIEDEVSEKERYNKQQYKIEEQFKTEKEILKKYAKGTYGIQNPYVINNPYGVAPLTALAIFETEVPCQIEVTIKGKQQGEDISYVLDGYRTHHEVPLLWLYPGISNQVELKATTENHIASSGKIEVTTQSLPQKLVDKNIQVAMKRKEMSDGLILLIDDYRTVVDENGEVRWYIDRELEVAGIEERLQNGHMLVQYEGNECNTKFVEMDWLGKIYWTHINHEILRNDALELPNGNIVTIGAEHLIEIDRKTGKRLKNIDFKELFRYKHSLELRSPEDEEWFYPNGLAYEDDNIIVSARNQHGLVSFEYKNEKLKWRMGSDVPYHQKYIMNYLQPIGRNFEWFYSQHHPTILPDLDHDVNTKDILLFDNGVHRSQQEATALPPEAMYSRIVHYRINEKMRTIEQIWDTEKSLGLPYYAEIYSGAQYLEEKGHYLGAFNVSATPEAATWTDFFKAEEHDYTSKVTEFGKNKEILHEITMETPLYRAYKVKPQELVKGFTNLGTCKGYTTYAH